MSGDHRREKDLPALDFSTFIISLGTSAQLHMGLVKPSDQDLNVEVSLPHAKQTIDILEMLQTKVKGNLEKEESELLSLLIHELKVSFVTQKEKFSKKS